ncbi:Putative zinc ribbon domain protein [Candidatus Bilamarchaeum dharawalense]|uniref:Zinc ribbon domain protein n=1 Tax=Candidatus Bilamarchaeum dharawalense TaxID=2885759 RepID=A0A5E4LPZ8_9ARCH|nr:Putative zinc ribbon domain protein [Candidatus Bilamarchaeum dharawalense]
MTLVMCESCGMPMAQKSDFGGGKMDNKYCKYCTLPNGVLKPRHEVRENMILFYMKTKKQDRATASAYVDERMASMPAWK